jgi:hypothetical protein
VEEVPVMDTVRKSAVAFTALLLALAWGLHAQEPRVVYRGRLPNNWTKLGLTEKQKEDVRGIMGKARGDVEKLEKQIQMVKAKALEDATAVLTDAQRARAEELKVKIAPKKAPEKPSDKPSKPPKDS